MSSIVVEEKDMKEIEKSMDILITNLQMEDNNEKVLGGVFNIDKNNFKDATKNTKIIEAGLNLGGDIRNYFDKVLSAIEIEDDGQMKEGYINLFLHQIDYVNAIIKYRLFGKRRSTSPQFGRNVNKQIWNKWRMLIRGYDERIDKVKMRLPNIGKVAEIGFKEKKKGGRKKKTRKKSTKKIRLTVTDYKKILTFYKLSIPKTYKKIKKKAEKIISKKFCSCIKKVQEKFKKEGIAIGICTKSVVNGKGYKRGTFKCKKKRTIKLYKGGRKRRTKKNQSGGVDPPNTSKNIQNKMDKLTQEDIQDQIVLEQDVNEGEENQEQINFLLDLEDLLQEQQQEQEQEEEEQENPGQYVVGSNVRVHPPYLGAGLNADSVYTILDSQDMLRVRGRNEILYRLQSVDNPNLMLLRLEGNLVEIQEGDNAHQQDFYGGKKTKRKRRRKRKGTKKKRRRRKRGGLNWFFTRNSDDNNLNIVIANKPKRKSVYGEPHWLRKFLVDPRDNDDFDEIDRIPDGFSISNPFPNPFLMFKGGGPFEDDVRAALSTEKIKGKKCLDIGTRDGLNCWMLVEKGADSVLGIDIDDGKFKDHDKVKMEKKITLRKQNLFEMDENEKFDVITCFLWNFGFPQLDDFAKKVKSLLREEGLFYLGLYDDIYVNGDEHYDSVPKQLERYFKTSNRVGQRPKRQQIWEMRVKQ